MKKYILILTNHKPSTILCMSPQHNPLVAEIHPTSGIGKLNDGRDFMCLNPIHQNIAGYRFSEMHVFENPSQPPLPRRIINMIGETRVDRYKTE